jgi:Calcium binding
MSCCTRSTRRKHRDAQRRRPGADQPPHLIDEITVDAHDDDEQLMGFEAAFDEDASLPCTGTIVGQQVQTLSVSRTSNRQELIATCQRDGRTYEVALLDIHLQADPATARLVAAYQRWIGGLAEST